MIRNQEKPRFIYVVIMSVLAGAVVGIIDIWAFEPSLRYFYGGIASGIALFSLFSVLNYFIPKGSVLPQMISWYFAGGVAGFISQEELVRNIINERPGKLPATLGSNENDRKNADHTLITCFFRNIRYQKFNCKIQNKADYQGF